MYSQHQPLFKQCVTYFISLICRQVIIFVVFNVATKRRFFSYCYKFLGVTARSTTPKMCAEADQK